MGELRVRTAKRDLPRHRREPPALERGVAYLLASEPSLRATGDTFYNVWTHTYLLQTTAQLLRSGLLPERHDEVRALLDRELELLRSTQGADGGWGYYDFDHAAATPSGDQTTSFNTASVLLALREAAAVGAEFEVARREDAVAVLERLRLPSGAYVYGTYAQFRPTANFNMVPGSIGRSQPCNLALHLAGVLSTEDLRAGVEALRRDHRYLQIGKGRPRPHEAYYQTSGYYYFYGHHYAAEAIALLPDPPRRELNDWMLEVIVGVQNPDGSWLDFPMYGYGKPYGTAFALLTLERCLATASEPSAGTADTDDSPAR
ncbi:MAG: prenyltransferase/squalene oxidase repeat-containing protein [Planctomycetota bacterium]